MPNICFADSLNVSGGSGTYTLMAYVNGAWIDVQTITGVTDGTINISASENFIQMDTSVFMVGQSYQFKWVDSNGLVSNIRTILIAQITLVSIVPDPDSTGCIVTIDANLLSGDIILVNAATGVGNGIGIGSLPINVTGQEYVVPYEEYIPGDSYYLLSNNTRSNTVIAQPFVNLMGISNDGSGNALIAFNAGFPAGSSLNLLNVTTGAVNAVTGISAPYNALNPSTAGGLNFVAGDEYRLYCVDGSGNRTYSNTLTAANMTINNLSQSGGKVIVDYSADVSIGAELAVAGFINTLEINTGAANIAATPVNVSNQSFNSGQDWGVPNYMQLQVFDGSGNIISATILTPIP